MVNNMWQDRGFIQINLASMFKLSFKPPRNFTVIYIISEFFKSRNSRLFSYLMVLFAILFLILLDILFALIVFL